MQVMGIGAIYPKRHTSEPEPEHRRYPYLLRNLSITAPNAVWGTDITYIPLERRFCYLIAILDWYSRYVVSWRLAPSLDTSYCCQAYEQAFRSAVPAISNSDQGRQFTARAFTELLESHHVRISMDGRGRCMDNIFTERLWRTVKQENIYLQRYPTLDDAQEGLEQYFHFYNHQRRHQSLGYLTPAEVYHQS
jgi:putative transposase